MLGKMDSYLKKNEITTFSNTTYKNKLKCIKHLNARPDTIKFIVENKCKTLT